MWLIRGVLRRRKDFVKKRTEVHFSIFIENRNWDLKFVFRFDNENEKRKKSKLYFILKKNQISLSTHGFNFFWIYFDLKRNSKNVNQPFRIHFLISNQKMNFKKFFHVSIWLWNWKMKKEKFSKFVLFLTQKTNYTFGTRIIKLNGFSIFKMTEHWNWKWSLFYVFHFNLKNEKPNLLKQIFMKLVTVSLYLITINMYEMIKEL